MGIHILLAFLPTASSTQVRKSSHSYIAVAYVVDFLLCNIKLEGKKDGLCNLPAVDKVLDPLSSLTDSSSCS